MQVGQDLSQNLCSGSCQRPAAAVGSNGKLAHGKGNEPLGKSVSSTPADGAPWVTLKPGAGWELLFLQRGDEEMAAFS
jgi:hypothetical protein